MKSMFMKLGGRKSKDQQGFRSVDEKICSASIDILEVFVKKAAGDQLFGSTWEAPQRDIELIVNSVYEGKLKLTLTLAPPLSLSLSVWLYLGSS
jgi:hypothetical protein